MAELTARQCRPVSPRKAAKSASKRLALGPVVIQPDLQRVDDLGDLFLADVGQREGQERRRWR